MDDTIKVTVKPSLKDIQNKLNAQRRKLADMGSANAKMAAFLDRWVQTNFKTQGGNVGGWAPFADSTLKKMAKEDPNRLPGVLLQNTGRLRSTFLPFADARQAGIGTNLKSASGAPIPLFHEEGTKHLPRRRMLPERKDVIARAKLIYGDFAAEVAGR